MLKKLKLSTKLWGLTGVLLFAVLVVAGNSIWSISEILSTNKGYSNAADSNTLIVEKEVDHFKWLKSVQDLFLKNETTLNVQLDPTKCGLGKFLYGEEGNRLAQSDQKLAGMLEDMKAPHKHLHESAGQIKEVWKKNHPGLSLMLAARLDDHRRWAGDVANALLENEETHVETDPTQCAFGKWLSGEECGRLVGEWPEFSSVIEKIREHHDNLHQSVTKLEDAVIQEEKTRLYADLTLPELEKIGALFAQAQKMEAELNSSQAEASHILETQTLPALNNTQAKMSAVREYLSNVKASAEETMIAKEVQSKTVAGVVTVIAFIIGGLLSFVSIRSITKPIHRIIGDLNEGSDQVASASGQVSSASQSLAEGTSEQAASIEEISSSLEEMASMTKQNAENAGRADHLMKEANQVVGQANESMTELTGSMEEISKASEETSKIIKTIDEIAFQTNLLALNAAVEAARAGEAGAGFAVVADEVRNLAMRAAEAAKNTADLIEGTVKKVNDGSELVTRTNKAFSQVAESAEKVAGLVGEIAAASNEQAQGIDQVNTAVADMDKVTQQNAANAEESASAAEEMNAQAEQMQGNVNDLVILVGGKAGTAVHTEPRQTEPSQTKRGWEHRTAKALAAPRRRTKTEAEQAIPLEDDDFKDF